MVTATVWKGCTKSPPSPPPREGEETGGGSLNEGPGGKLPGPSCFLATDCVRIPDNLSRNTLVIVEVESNDNCESSFFARFKEAGPARPVLQVRLYDRNPVGEWYWVTGWSDNNQAPACPAYMQLVEDSGAGLTHLVYGGIYGLRFKPLDIDEPWSLESPHQWGEAYLSLADDRDLRAA